MKKLFKLLFQVDGHYNLKFQKNINFKKIKIKCKDKKQCNFKIYTVKDIFISIFLVVVDC